MLRIELDSCAEDATTLRLEGRVTGQWVSELQRSCDQALGAGRDVVLDLRSVSFIGRDGLELIGALPRDRVRVQRCSPFIAEQLKRVWS
jgi:anti-anti-sigma regulatory factor